jgi:hypothetical protein
MESWSRKFEEPIPLPKGRQFITLKDAGTYITKLPKAEHTAPEWQAAMEALILVAARGGPTMLARIGIMQALRRWRKRLVLAPLRKVRGKSRTHRRASRAQPSCLRGDATFIEVYAKTLPALMKKALDAHATKH